MIEHKHFSPRVLTGGRWLTVRGVQRWVTYEDDIRAYTEAQEDRAAHGPEPDREALLAKLTTERNLPPLWWSRSSAKKHRAARRRMEAVG